MEQNTPEQKDNGVKVAVEDVLNQYPRYRSTYEGITNYTINWDDSLKAMEEYAKPFRDRVKELEGENERLNKIYLSAVNGRADFRKAVKQLRDEKQSLESEVERLKARITQLEEALTSVIDACEDKGGQFRAWHQHLRSTTKAGKELLQALNPQDNQK